MYQAHIYDLGLLNTPITIANKAEFLAEIASVGPGDVLNLNDGNYDLGNVTISASGTPTQPIVIRSRQAPQGARLHGQGTINVTGNYVYFALLDLDDYYFTFNHNGQGGGQCRITRSLFRNSNNNDGCINLQDSSENRIDHCHFIDLQERGIQLNPVNLADDFDTANMDRMQDNLIDWNLFQWQIQTGGNGLEPIGLGTGKQDSLVRLRTLIEFNYVNVVANGEGEPISVKSSDNIIRWNTWTNPDWQLQNNSFSLRHGNRNEVYGNVIIDYRSFTVGGDSHQVLANEMRLVNATGHRAFMELKKGNRLNTPGQWVGENNNIGNHPATSNAVIAGNVLAKGIEVGFGSPGSDPNQNLNIPAQDNTIYDNTVGEAVELGLQQNNNLDAGVYPEELPEIIELTESEVGLDAPDPMEEGPGIMSDTKTLTLDFDDQVFPDPSEDSVAAAHSYSFIDTDTRTGTGYALRFELNGDDTGEIYGNFQDPVVRAEAQLNKTQVVGDERWFGFSVKFDSFVDSSSDPNGTIFFQLHAKPDIGESGRVPPFAMKMKPDKELFAVIRHDENLISGPPSTIPKVTIPLGTAELGVWYDWIIHIGIEYDSSGYLEVWQNDVQVIDYNGPTYFNDVDFQGFMKFGIYRGWLQNNPSSGNDPDDEMIFVFDEFRMRDETGSYDAVRPTGPLTAAVTITDNIADSEEVGPDPFDWTATLENHEVGDTVQFLIDDVEVSTDNTNPYTINVDPATYGSGAHSMKVVHVASQTEHEDTGVVFSVPVVVTQTIQSNDDLGPDPFTWDVTVTPDSPEVFVEWYVDDVLVLSETAAPYGNTGTNQFPQFDGWNDPLNYTEGSHEFKVIETNSGEQSVVTANIVHPIPAVTVDDNLTTNMVIGPNPFLWVATIENHQSGDEVQFKINGNVALSSTVEPYQYQIDPSEFGDGIYVLDLLHVGSGTFKQTTVVIDAAASITHNLVDNGSAGPGEFDWTVTLEDAEAGDEVQFLIDGVQVDSQTAGYEITVDTATLEPGVHEFTARYVPTALEVVSDLTITPTVVAGYQSETTVTQLPDGKFSMNVVLRKVDQFDNPIAAAFVVDGLSMANVAGELVVDLSGEETNI